MALTRPPQRPASSGSAPYWEPEVYDRERERIFGLAWFFVGHEAMIPNSGDYMTNFIGDDPIILSRANDGTVHVLLNRCRHRGNKVCLYDMGNAKSFRCTYHGWAYAGNGELAAVPQQSQLYDGAFDRAEWGLFAAPQVASYRGLIFATWNPQAVRLEHYLGADLQWYLDRLAFDDPDGWEVLPGRHRYMIPTNWKLLAENFGGDSYHFQTTHASLNALNRRGQVDRIRSGEVVKGTRYGVEFTGPEHPPHALQLLSVGDEFINADLQSAEALSPAAVAWVRERHRRRQELCAGGSIVPYGFHTGTIWPNLSLNGFGTALYGRTLLLWHPRGPESTEVWQWCFVEKSAPPEVKERMAFTLMQRQAAAGMVAPDDVDNFQRMHDVLHTGQAMKFGFNYDLGRAHDAVSLFPDLPGRVSPEVSEGYHRAFYGYWHSIMDGA